MFRDLANHDAVQVSMMKRQDADLTGALSDFEDEALDRAMEYVTDPNQADNVNFRVLGVEQPFDQNDEPTPALENAFEQYARETDALMDMYRYAGNHATAVRAEDLNELFRDVDAFLREAGIGPIATDLDEEFVGAAQAAANKARETIQEQAIGDAVEPIGQVWDQAAHRLQQLDNKTRDIEQLLNRVGDVEDLWYDVTGDNMLEAAKTLEEELKTILEIADDLGREYTGDIQDALFFTAGAADEAASKVGKAIEEMQTYAKTSRRHRRSSRQLCASCRRRQRRARRQRSRRPRKRRRRR